MPDLDVSPALESSMLSDAFTIIRRIETVAVNGISSTSISTINAYGSIQPASSNDLKRVPDYDLTMKGIIIYTEATLQASVPNGKPDQIPWNGNIYQVAHCEDYTNWGLSWTKAIAILIDAQPAQQPAQNYQEPYPAEC
jgi:hypothetical protein